MLETGSGAGPDRCDNGAQPVVLDEPIAMARIDEPISDIVPVELSAGDQLKQTE